MRAEKFFDILQKSEKTLVQIIRLNFIFVPLGMREKLFIMWGGVTKKIPT